MGKAEVDQNEISTDRKHISRSKQVPGMGLEFQHLSLRDLQNKELSRVCVILCCIN